MTRRRCVAPDAEAAQARLAELQAREQARYTHYGSTRYGFTHCGHTLYTYTRYTCMPYTYPPRTALSYSPRENGRRLCALRRYALRLYPHPHPNPHPHQVTRQYRKLARKWHPDRYKGLKVRAERKMRECSEAKEVLVKQMGC